MELFVNTENACKILKNGNNIYTERQQLGGTMIALYKKMAEHSPTGSITIPLSDDTTPDYNAVRKSYGEINPAIIPSDFVS